MRLVTSNFTKCIHEMKHMIPALAKSMPLQAMYQDSVATEACVTCESVTINGTTPIDTIHQSICDAKDKSIAERANTTIKMPIPFR